MLARDDVDIVSVCTPNYQHAADVVTIASGKHILIEQPPATDQRLRAMDAAERRQDPRVSSSTGTLVPAKRVIAEGLLGGDTGPAGLLASADRRG